MRYIYLSVIFILLASALLFTGSFIYLDVVNHKTFHYSIQSVGKEIGTIRVDRFLTEDKIIYKSVTSLPFEPQYTEYRSRLVMDKNYTLESFTKERVSGRSTDSIYLENFKNLVSFVTRYLSRFAYLENIPIKKETYLFEEDSPVTYMPIIDNYNFSKGRSQGFNTISFLQSWNLPPMKRFIILTSIKDEKVKIDNRKIWTENLILKIRDFPQGAVWVAKSDRSIVKIDIPSRNINIIRTYHQKHLKVTSSSIKKSGYSTKDVMFKSKGIELSGTLTFPSDNGSFPALIFSPGPGPYDRDCQGLFAGISEYLSKNGYVCLRFDKRGIGSSGGDFISSTESVDIEDLNSGIQYLAGQKIVDPDKIFIIGQGRGAINAIKAAGKNSSIKGIIMMSPSLYPYVEARSKDDLGQNFRKSKWTDDYLSLVLKTARESQAKAVSSDSDWAYILGKRCFLGSIREELPNGPLAEPVELPIPVLVLQGKESDDVYGDSSMTIDKMLTSAGKEDHSLTYYAYLGSFFGQKISDGTRRAYYDTDKDVLENIRNWLYETLKPKAVALVGDVKQEAL